MKCVRRVEALAGTVGAMVEIDREYGILVTAPSGYVWIANGCVDIACDAVGFSSTYWVDACRDVIYQMRYGLRLADDEDMARIAEDEQVEPGQWVAPAGAPERLELA